MNIPLPPAVRVVPYSVAARNWPAAGRQILASFDEATLVVYQAFRPSIADFAVRHQQFGGDFRLTRMSWIKPGFLWMMHRSAWASAPSQERVLAVSLSHGFFDAILRCAVASSFGGARGVTPDLWRAAVGRSAVRAQWDPDHDTYGRALERRAIQLGLRGDMLRRYATDEPVRIDDVTEFVVSQRRVRDAGGDPAVPDERVFSPSPDAAANVGTASSRP